MEVTDDNLDAILPKLFNSLSEATFVSFDLEFTGIGDGAGSVWPYDLPELIYQKYKTNVEQYSVIQLGLCMFQYDQEFDCYTYEAYNLFLYPQPLKIGIKVWDCQLQPAFLYQPSALKFLHSQGFDLNKWVAKGIGYLLPQRAMEIEKELKNRAQWKIDDAIKRTKSSADKLYTPKIPDDLKPNINRVMKSVADFVTNSNDTKLTLPSSVTPFERRLLFELIPAKYGLSLCCESYSEINNSSHSAEYDRKKVVMVIEKCLAEGGYQKIVESKLEDDLNVLRRYTNLGKILKILKEKNILLVGHNVILDVMHLLQTFVQPLPLNYSEFKMLVCNKIPRFFDTKLFSNEKPLKEVLKGMSNLNEIYQATQKHPFTDLIKLKAKHPDFDYNFSKSNLHEAGYDAYITGSIFLTMSKYFQQWKSPSQSLPNVDFEVINVFFGKVSMLKVQDLPYLNLAENDAIPDRSHIFYVRFVNDGITKQDVVGLFSAHCGLVNVYWIDCRSAFVVMINGNRETGAEAYKQLKSNTKISGICSVLLLANEYLRNHLSAVLSGAAVRKRIRSENNSIKNNVGHVSASGAKSELNLRLQEMQVVKQSIISEHKIFKESNDWS